MLIYLPRDYSVTEPPVVYVCVPSHDTMRALWFFLATLMSSDALLIQPSPFSRLDLKLSVRGSKLNPEVDSSTESSPASPSSRFYNDDAFGLVFLSSAIAIKDEVFASIFLAFSASAALMVFSEKVSFTHRLPAAVAAVTLALSTLAGNFGIHSRDPLPNAIELESAVCFVSVAWGLWRTKGES